jgi:hypothetical protein
LLSLLTLAAQVGRKLLARPTTPPTRLGLAGMGPFIPSFLATFGGRPATLVRSIRLGFLSVGLFRREGPAYEPLDPNRDSSMGYAV